MITIITMYSAKLNSPITTLVSAITTASTTITVTDSSVFPTAPNIATIGTTTAAETILYTGISSGNLTGVTRGFQNTAGIWSAGSTISRFFTAYDHDSFKTNIETVTTQVVNLLDEYDYGGAVSTFQIENGVTADHKVTLTLNHTETSDNAIPRDTIRIYRNIASTGGTGNQNGGIIVRETVQSTCNHHEFGIFSILDNYAQYATENVGIYSQATGYSASQSALWGGVFEVRNINSLGQGTTQDPALNGIEVDVVNVKVFSDTQRKMGISLIAYGGGECTDALSIYAANNTRGTGAYGTGHWRYGLRLNPNCLHETLSYGIYLESTHGSGIVITGTSANYGINLASSGAVTTAINVNSSYTNALALQANKNIKLNGEGSSQSIRWDSTLSAVIFDGASIGVENHTNYNTATAGGTQAVPATVSGYIGVYVNGFLKKVPYFNT